MTGFVNSLHLILGLPAGLINSFNKIKYFHFHNNGTMPEILKNNT
jgi:hypothetical protein